uniref:Uncharacterized protein n=1 Tax=Salmonella phage PMBT29 TaxID=3137286 RepID=A0AAU8BUP7_9VIRU
MGYYSVGIPFLHFKIPFTNSIRLCILYSLIGRTSPIIERKQEKLMLYMGCRRFYGSTKANNKRYKY